MTQLIEKSRGRDSSSERNDNPNGTITHRADRRRHAHIDTLSGMKRVIAAALGALAGLAFSTLGLVDFSHGLPDMTGGNDATPIVIAAGISIGALVGAAVLWRFPFAIVGAIVGLAAGMWLRDNLGLGGVQPPWVFLLLFGLPGLGLAGGYLVHLPLSTWTRYPAIAGALVGLATSVGSYAAGAFVWAAATNDPACEPTPLPGGGVRVQFCPDTGVPFWVFLAALVLGAATGHITRNKLSSTNGPRTDGG